MPFLKQAIFTTIWILCMVGAISLVWSQVDKYLNGATSMSVALEQFDEKIFPTFVFCLKNPFTDPTLVNIRFINMYSC